MCYVLPLLLQSGTNKFHWPEYLRDKIHAYSLIWAVIICTNLTVHNTAVFSFWYTALSTGASTPYGHVTLAKRQFRSAFGGASKQERYSVTWWSGY